MMSLQNKNIKCFISIIAIVVVNKQKESVTVTVIGLLYSNFCFRIQVFEWADRNAFKCKHPKPDIYNESIYTNSRVLHLNAQY